MIQKNLFDTKKVIKAAIGHHLDMDKTFVFLFGSRAAGIHRRASDFDIGLYSGRKIPLKKIAMIKDELENYPIPVDIDIVDFSVVTDDFKNLAKKEIKIWHVPKKNFKRKWPF